MFMTHTRFFFIRHGETDWNVAQRMQGKTDIALNHNGRQQADKAKDIFTNLSIDRIVTSDLARAQETATIINSALQKDLHMHAGLQERHFGILEGMTRMEIENHPQENLFHDIMEDNGFKLALRAETLPDFDRRVINTLHTLLQQYAGNTLLLVSHGGVFSSLCRQLLKQNHHCSNAVPYQFSFDGSTWALEEHG